MDHSAYTRYRPETQLNHTSSISATFKLAPVILNKRENERTDGEKKKSTELVQQLTAHIKSKLTEDIKLAEIKEIRYS